MSRSAADFDPEFRPSPEATHLWATEARLEVLCRHLLAACERPSPIRRDLIALVAQAQRIRRRALEEAAKR